MMQRAPLIAGNWKMNTTLDEAQLLVSKMLPKLDEIKGVGKVICPPFVSLAVIGSMLKGTSVSVGAQNMYFEDQGAYTGEVSPVMLKPLCRYVIIGHSERRHLFYETNDIINKKILKALDYGLWPILCTGETLAERQAGKAEEVIISQLKGALNGVKNTNNMLIAYEPVWAIGTGISATADDVKCIMNTINQVLINIFGAEAAGAIRLLYGGSVTAQNFEDYILLPGVDGALVGGASLKPEAFISIVEQAAKAKGIY